VGSSTSFEEANCEWQESLPLCQPLNWKENKCQILGKRQIDDDLEIDVPFDIVDFAEGPKVRLRSLDYRYLHLILLYWVRVQYIMGSIPEDYKICICCFSTKHTALRRKNKDWLARNQDNMSEWGDMSIH
jgi:hypothetical protein